MSYGCGCQDCCTDCCHNCCTVTPLFWIYILGIAGAFVSLFFFFWQYPGTLTQFKGPKEEGYAFVEDGQGPGSFAVIRDGLLVGNGALFLSDELPDLRHARCRGTSLLWTMLIGGFLGALWLLWLFVQCPNRFICCSLQQPYMEMRSQLYPNATPAKQMVQQPMPVKVLSVLPVVAPTMPAPMTPPQSPGPKLA